MSGQDLYIKLGAIIDLLNNALKEYRKRGLAYAEAERDYRVALAKEILMQRNAGMPVTIISDVCRGDQKIADLKFERDCAEAIYKSAGEAINTYKLQIRLIESQIQREYSG